MCKGSPSSAAAPHVAIHQTAVRKHQNTTIRGGFREGGSSTERTMRLKSSISDSLRLLVKLMIPVQPLVGFSHSVAVRGCWLWRHQPETSLISTYEYYLRLNNKKKFEKSQSLSNCFWIMDDVIGAESRSGWKTTQCDHETFLEQFDRRWWKWRNSGNLPSDQLSRVTSESLRKGSQSKHTSTPQTPSRLHTCVRVSAFVSEKERKSDSLSHHILKGFFFPTKISSWTHFYV